MRKKDEEGGRRRRKMRKRKKRRKKEGKKERKEREERKKERKEESNMTRLTCSCILLHVALSRCRWPCFCQFWGGRLKGFDPSIALLIVAAFLRSPSCFGSWCSYN